jgi:hypothetical protein
MKVKESKIAFISFYLLFRIGTFQWVMAKKIKKSDSASTRVVGCVGVSFHPFLRGAPGGAAHCPVNMSTIAHRSDYRKNIHVGLRQGIVMETKVSSTNECVRWALSTFTRHLTEALSYALGCSTKPRGFVVHRRHRS